MPLQLTPEQLQPGEAPVEATLPDGRKITVLYVDGIELFTRPGRAANFGGVAHSPMPQCCHFYVPLPGGRTLSLFVNTDTGLLCADVVNRSETGGVEIMRRTFGEITKPSRAPQGRRFALESLEEEGE